MRPILLVDGRCSLCHATVRFVVRHEADTSMDFASLQSDVARRLLSHYRLDTSRVQSLVLIDESGAHVRSEAVWRLARRLRGPWKAVVLVRIVPRSIRDSLYDLVARRRYAWFGARASCEIGSGASDDRLLGISGPPSVRSSSRSSP